MRAVEPTKALVAGAYVEEADPISAAAGCGVSQAAGTVAAAMLSRRSAREPLVPVNGALRELLPNAPHGGAVHVEVPLLLGRDAAARRRPNLKSRHNIVEEEGRDLNESELGWLLGSRGASPPIGCKDHPAAVIRDDRPSAPACRGVEMNAPPHELACQGLSRNVAADQMSSLIAGRLHYVGSLGRLACRLLS